MDVPCLKWTSTDLQNVSFQTFVVQILVVTAASRNLLAARQQDRVARGTVRAES
jgi:hypothetical protein